MPPPSNPSRWFSERVLPHEGVLRAWLRRRFGTAVEIDDIVQEAFLRVLKANAGGTMTSPKAFVFTTARNLALDRLRRHEVTRVEPLEEKHSANVLDTGDEIPETVARKQEFELLNAAIQSLPARCREVFTLRKLHGLSQREIADRLGISESTVSNQLIIGVQKCTAFFAAHRAAGGAPE